MVFPPDMFKGWPTLGDLMDMTWKDWLFAIGINALIWGPFTLGVWIFL